MKLWVRKRSPIHRWGLFAAADIAKGTKIIEYTGPRVSSERGEELLARGVDNVYVLTKDIFIDGRPRKNPAGYINYSCYPNCRPLGRNMRIWVVAKRRIKAGEELTWDYEYSFGEGVTRPCNCGHPRCIGVQVSAQCGYRPLLRSIVKRVVIRKAQYEEERTKRKQMGKARRSSSRVPQVKR